MSLTIFQRKSPGESPRASTPFFKPNRLFVILFFFPFLLIADAGEPHHTTAFIAPPQTISTLVTCSFYSTRHFWNKNGKERPTFNSFKEWDYLLYSEYALNQYNSLFIHGGYSLIRESMNGNSHALRDLEIGLKHGFLEEGPSAISMEVIAIAPIGDTKSSVRYGKPGLQLSLLFSQILHSTKNLAWIDSGFGYRYYQGFPSSQLRSFLSLGIEATPAITFIATGELECGLFNGNGKKNYNNIAFNPNYRLLSGKIECLAKICAPIFISVGAYHRFWGQNVGSGGGAFCGSWLCF